MIKLTQAGVKINTNLVWTSHNTRGVEFNTGVFTVRACSQQFHFCFCFCVCFLFFMLHTENVPLSIFRTKFCVQVPRRTNDTRVWCISPKDALFVMLLRAQFKHLKRAQKMSAAFKIFNFEENFMLGNLDQFTFKVPRAHCPPPPWAYIGSLSYFIML